MSIPFSNPYSSPTGKTWQNLLYEISLGSSERDIAEIGPYDAFWHFPDWNITTDFALHNCKYKERLWKTLQEDVENIGHEPDESGSVWWTEVAVRDIQSYQYWGGDWLEDDGYPLSGLQQWEESWADYFVDHINGPLTPDGLDILYLDLTKWRGYAGLNSGGFRRSIDNGVTFLYGLMQAGDHIGPWIFEDLQKGLSALRWTFGTDLRPFSPPYFERILYFGSWLYKWNFTNQNT